MAKRESSAPIEPVLSRAGHGEGGGILKIIALSPVLAFLAGTAVHAAPAPPPEAAPVPVVLLVEGGSGQRLYARREDLRFVPASVTKVMSAWVAFQLLAQGKLTERQVMTFSPQSWAIWHGRGTSMGLRRGERVPVETLLRGITTVSANEAAVSLAEGAAGSIPAWSSLMNAEAQRLGMRNSHFASPNGWPDDGATYVTARDLVTLGAAVVYRHPDFYRKYFGQKRLTWNGVTGVNRDPTLGVVAGADGIKTGHTAEAGFNFLGTAERGGRRLFVVVAGARSEAERAAASRALLEWGFARWHGRKLFDAGRRIASADVQGGSSRQVRLSAASPVWFASNSKKTDISAKIEYSGPLVAPIRKGAVVARLVLDAPGEPTGVVPLQAMDDVPSAGPLDRLWNGLIGLFS